MMLEYGQMLASLCAGVSVMFATLVIVEFASFASARYKERYLRDTAVELDDVFLQMPAGRIFDLTIALSGLSAFISLIVFGMSSTSWSWPKAAFIAALAAVVTFPAPRLYLKFLGKRRLEKFNEQLEDALNSMSSALKAGFSINQAIEVIASENRNPISIEFRLLLQEIRLGVQLEQALENMVKRIGSEDFELVATAILTARQTGGELTVIFERLAGMIRERMRIAGKLRALTAQGRQQSNVVGAMPFLLMIVMNYIAPDMMSAFFNSMAGILLIIGAVMLVAMGFMVIRKITNIDI
ncbi:MAG: type II secretion system F family protein [Lentisphaerae bacterium]|nr:type II secretion system F family protein [Lentisphaerota bacterium]